MCHKTIHSDVVQINQKLLIYIGRLSIANRIEPTKFLMYYVFE